MNKMSHKRFFAACIISLFLILMGEIIVYNPTTILHDVNITGYLSIIGLDASSLVLTNENKTLVTDDISNYLNPVGVIQMWSVASPPTGWLVCDGSAVSRTTYSDLFAVIGTTYGVGDGSTTFNLPNFVGAMPVGLNASDSAINAMGERGGYLDHTHIFTGSGGGGGTTAAQLTGVNNVQAYSSGAPVVVAVSTHVHGFSFGFGFGGMTNQQYLSGATGTDLRPPYITIKYIIKY